MFSRLVTSRGNTRGLTSKLFTFSRLNTGKQHKMFTAQSTHMVTAAMFTSQATHMVTHVMFTPQATLGVTATPSRGTPLSASASTSSTPLYYLFYSSTGRGC